jgi:hypothetical protein
MPDQKTPSPAKTDEERNDRKRHRGVGGEGIRQEQRLGSEGSDQGLGHEGVEPDRPVKNSRREKTDNG